MSFWGMLYKLIIGPLELLFEAIFMLATHISHNYGLSIIALSLVMNFLLLPLYNRADAIQQEAADTEKRLRPRVKRIKNAFKGDERFMMLQTYYRQNHYKPTDVLKGSVSLLLEIPFFIAAYNFLSNLDALKEISFGPIANLAAPDGMLAIAGITINVLPILMTVINIISSAIYTRGQPLRSKIQLYGMAAIFLVLLYQSPSGLVMYWTLNNLFSLVKNIIVKLKHKKEILTIGASVCGVALLIGSFIIHVTPRQKILLCAVAVLLQIPLILMLTKHRRKAKDLPKEEPRVHNKLFLVGCIFLALLTGLLIPSAVIASSPEEFINLQTISSPLWYVLSAVMLATGTFVLWFGVFYRLAAPRSKNLMNVIVWCLSGTATVNYMFFGTKFGILTRTLMYENRVHIGGLELLVNTLVFLAVIGLFWLIWKKKIQISKAVYAAGIVALAVMSSINLVKTNQTYHDFCDRKTVQTEEEISIPLSREGKNVVILMMDRAINGYLPYIMDECPELKEQFSGFTYYPNTLSYGPSTIFAAPSLFGGYDYLPNKINDRAEEKLVEKHDEALHVLPVLFDENGYDVTVCDPSFAGYTWNPDTSIYDDCPDIRAINVEGRYTDPVEQEVPSHYDEKLNRNLFCYSLFRCAPSVIQPTLYDDGNYYSSVIADQHLYGPHKAEGLKNSFMRAYSVLENLPQITEVTDKKNGTFLMMSNNSTHEPMLLQTPDYKPAPKVDNEQYDEAHQDRVTSDGRVLHMETENQYTHYHCNVAAMKELGKWLDYLRESGVYDNTRIIIVADHGAVDLRQFDDMIFGDKKSEDAMAYNPLLMFKDFNSNEFTVDPSFMTNADVPTLALGSIVENPVNPYTGNPIENSEKYEPEQYVFFSEDWDTNVNNGNTFLPGEWFKLVNQNIFDAKNWSSAEEP